MTDQPQGAILVGVDGSRNASIAVAWAVEIGERMKTPVSAVAAWPEIPSPYIDRIDDHVAAMNAQQADAASSSLLDAGISGIEVTAAPGPVAEVLLSAAEKLDTSMLVVGTRGLGLLSGLLLGSISRYLLFNTRRPLVVVPNESTLTPPALTRVLVGIDRSPVAERVSSWAAQLCADLGVPATIVRCADPGCERPPGFVERVDDTIRADARMMAIPRIMAPTMIPSEVFWSSSISLRTENGAIFTISQMQIPKRTRPTMVKTTARMTGITRSDIRSNAAGASTRGYSMPGTYPSIVRESEWHTPHASTLTRTSPAPGWRRSRSASSKVSPGPDTCMTRVVAVGIAPSQPPPGVSGGPTQQRPGTNS